jgi:hypothetical protein
MREILKALMSSNCNNTNPHLVTVTDAIGSYRRYVKGYAGIAWEVVVGSSFDTTIGADGSKQLIINADGSIASLPASPGIIGVQVTALAGGVPTASTNPQQPIPFVPGFTGQAINYPIFTPLATATPTNDLVDSPFLGTINVGDIITNVNRNELGDLDHQVAPSWSTWPKIPGDTIRVTYYKASEQYSTPYLAVGTLATFPQLMDFPWYAIDKYPLIAGLAVGQLVNPLVPAFITFPITTGFRPAF